MYWSDWFVGRRNRFYSIGVFWILWVVVVVVGWLFGQLTVVCLFVCVCVCVWEYFEAYIGAMCNTKWDTPQHTTPSGLPLPLPKQPSHNNNNNSQHLKYSYAIKLVPSANKPIRPIHKLNTGNNYCCCCSQIFLSNHITFTLLGQDLQAC